MYLTDLAIMYMFSYNVLFRKVRGHQQYKKVRGPGPGLPVSDACAVNEVM